MGYVTQTDGGRRRNVQRRNLAPAFARFRSGGTLTGFHAVLHVSINSNGLWHQDGASTSQATPDDGAAVDLTALARRPPLRDGGARLAITPDRSVSRGRRPQPARPRAVRLVPTAQIGRRQGQRRGPDGKPSTGRRGRCVGGATMSELPGSDRGPPRISAPGGPANLLDDAVEPEFDVDQRCCPTSPSGSCRLCR